MQRELFFNSSWAWWVYVVVGVAAVALIVHLYRLERGEAGRIKGAVLTALRLMLVTLVLAMLAQPVLRTRRTITQQRQLAVLLDDSLSMRIADPQASPAERLRWADGIGLLAHDARPFRPEALSAQLAIVGRMAGRLAAELNELRLYRSRQTPVPETLAQALPRTTAGLAATVATLHDLARPLGEQTELRGLLRAEGQAQWVRLADRLSNELLPAADELAKSAASARAGADAKKADAALLVKLIAQTDKLIGQCRAVAEMIDAPLGGSTTPRSGTGAGATSLAWAIDAAVAGRLDAESRAALDHVAQLSREELARRLLVSQGGNLLDRIRRAGETEENSEDIDEQFVVNVYRFARTSARLPVDKLIDQQESKTASPGTPEPAATDQKQNEPPQPGPQAEAAEDLTDPAAAIEQIFIQAGAGTDSVRSESAVPRQAAPERRGQGSVAGIVILTDGRFNGAGDPAGTARQHRVPIYPVRIGSADPPTDLAVLKLETPDSLFREDTANVVALVKMDGLAGRQIDVRLVELPASRDGPVKVIQSKRLRPTAPAERRLVELKLKPDRIGVVNYRIEAKLAPASGGAPAGGDIMPANDRQDFAVVVTEEPTKVLIVDGPPRWEFRYLTNLLLRDKGILVQHLCTSPAFIQASRKARPTAPGRAGVSPSGPAARPVRHASVKEAREKGIREVDAMPATLEELFAFDVVILGDVSPLDLPDAAQRDLDRFVSERGGTLILIAGKESMPARYADHPLVSLMPVKLADDPGALALQVASLKPFRLRLTDLGARSDILRLTLEPGENQKVWDRLRPSTWRDAALSAKTGATVLAYAEPVRGEEDGTNGAEQPPAPDEDAEPDAAERERAARQRPLILVHNYGLGQVMLLTYDRTWQLRYKVGDKYHHKLWAQVMRWATAGRLPAGTEHVKLGTDRVRYRPGAQMTIRAKLSKDDFTPVNEADLAAEVVRDGKVVARVNLLPARMGSRQAGGLQRTPATASAPADEPFIRATSLDGVFVATLGPLPAGAYTIALKVAEAEGLSATHLRQSVSVKCFVEGDDPVEMQELAARSPTELADGGLVLAPSTARLVHQLFGDPVRRLRRNDDLALWSSGIWLALFALIACAEWVLRKKCGLI